MALLNWPNHLRHCKESPLYCTTFHSGRWCVLEDASSWAKSCTVNAAGSVRGVAIYQVGTTSDPPTFMGALHETIGPEDGFKQSTVPPLVTGTTCGTVTLLSLSVIGALERPCRADCDMATSGTEHPVVGKIHADRIGKTWLTDTAKVEFGFEVAVGWATIDRGSGLVGFGCGWKAFGWTEFWVYFIEGWFNLVRLGTPTEGGAMLGLPLSVATSAPTPVRDPGSVSFSTLEPCTGGWFATSVEALMT